MAVGDPGGAFTRVQVLAKVRDILDLFTPEEPELDLRAIRTRSGLPASTCLRLLQNMELDGLLDQRAGVYRIGLAMVRWASVARHGLGLVEVAGPELRRVRDAVGETTGLFVRTGRLRVCVGLAEGPEVVGRRLTVGHVAPLHANAAGKAILAHDPDALLALDGVELEHFTPRTRTAEELPGELAEIRARGYAVSLGEWNEQVG
ncbi:IclR family transcriptional regulator, partial [Pseudonocardia pini]|uniref:IclR family transcriptional regulator n=1 Tax=Pseudonocardia pini TaxID=2758030 RepID=UPI0015F112E1